MFNKGTRIGLALSGGGIRALIFHLGILKFLAENGNLENVKTISTVSGGSICIGLILSINDYKWPTSKEYLEKVLPECEGIVLNNDITSGMMRLKEKYPDYDTVMLLAKALEEEWGVHGDLQTIPSSINWEINCATFETTKNFRFSKRRMGDPLLGYTMNPDFPISNAVAASAAFPEIIGTYRLDMSLYKWYKDALGNTPLTDPRDFCNLWDGGVYDNLGLEVLYRPGFGLKKGIDFLVVSDASSPIYEQEYSKESRFENLQRIWDISVKKLNELVVRSLFRDVINKGKGAYLKTGTFILDVLKKLPIPQKIIVKLGETSLSHEKVILAMNYPTTLIAPTSEEFKLILRHGYETAACIRIKSMIKSYRYFKVN